MSEKTRILVTEDDDAQRQLTAHVLERAGYQVIEASSGEECLRLARGHAPDLILLDVMMPGMDGFETCRRIKSDPQLANSYVVIFSGAQTTSQNQAEGLEMGADGYIVRPISNRELLARVKSILRLKRTEDALRESEMRYRLLTETARDFIVAHDLQGNITYINQAALAFSGYSKEEIMAHSIAEFVPPDHRATLMQRETKRKEGNTERYLYETEFMDKAGRRVPVEVSSSPIKQDGRISGILLVARDITERKRAREALAESEERFRRAIIDAPFPIMIHAEDGEVIQINTTWTELTGYTHAEIPTIDAWTEKAYGQRQAAVQASIDKLYQLDGKVAEGRYEIKAKDGASIIWEFSSSPLGRLPDGRRLVISIAFDITERVRSEEKRARAEAELRRHRDHLEELVAERTTALDQRVAEVERLNQAMVNLLEDMQITNRNLEATTQQLKDTNAELESFSYSVSHDLRAPLRAMDGFSRILLEEHAAELPPAARRYLNKIYDNAQQMGQLIDDLLTLSRLSRQAIEIQPVDINKLLAEVWQDLSPEREGRRIVFTVDDFPPCEADPGLVRQVFVNLLSNALKFTRQREVARIEVGCDHTHNACTCFVRDNGVGFDMRYADKLFGVFQRLHRAEDYEGTGVGLAIVQRIIHRHGGRIWAESAVDQGASFYFTIDTDQ